ncbi:MAG: hypothetical protein FWD55_05255 [Propionibacteriaceae bacterium]|nr:hypothetical protein [Propionibacteriaceae bacterium]
MSNDHSLLNSWAGAHTALLVEGQSILAGLIGSTSPDWELNLASGLITLNETRLQFGLLGSVDDKNNWLWSWANPDMDRHATAIARVIPLKTFGAETGLWEFSQPSFSMDSVIDLGMTPGATIAMVACPQIMGTAVFSGSTGDTRLYTVITDPRLSLEAPSAFTAQKYIQAGIAYGVGVHKDIVTVYAGAHQLGVEEVQDKVTLQFLDGSRLEIQFDWQGSILQMSEVLSSD